MIYKYNINHFIYLHIDPRMGPVHVFSASSGVTELPSAVVLNAKPYRRTGYQESRTGQEDRRTGEQENRRTGGRDRRAGQEAGAGGVYNERQEDGTGGRVYNERQEEEGGGRGRAVARGVGAEER